MKAESSEHMLETSNEDTVSSVGDPPKGKDNAMKDLTIPIADISQFEKEMGPILCDVSPSNWADTIYFRDPDNNVQNERAEEECSIFLKNWVIHYAESVYWLPTANEVQMMHSSYFKKGSIRTREDMAAEMAQSSKMSFQPCWGGRLIVLRHLWNQHRIHEDKVPLGKRNTKYHTHLSRKHFLGHTNNLQPRLSVTLIMTQETS